MEMKTEADCQVAAAELGLNPHIGWRGSHKDIPRGCSYQPYNNGRGALHFNTHGSGNKRHDMVPICRVYHMTKKGDRCDSYNAINGWGADISVCRHAARIAGFSETEITRTAGWTGSHSQIPRGCSFGTNIKPYNYNNNGALHFNTRSSGDGHGQFRAICEYEDTAGFTDIGPLGCHKDVRYLSPMEVCRDAEGDGNCQMWGAFAYKKCKVGFHPVGCCVCSPDCPSGFEDWGVSCWKGVGLQMRTEKCDGVLTVDCGLYCARDQAACDIFITEAAFHTGMVMINVVVFVDTFGASALKTQAAQGTATAVGGTALQSASSVATKVLPKIGTWAHKGFYLAGTNAPELLTRKVIAEWFIKKAAIKTAIYVIKYVVMEYGIKPLFHGHVLEDLAKDSLSDTYAQEEIQTILRIIARLPEDAETSNMYTMAQKKFDTYSWIDPTGITALVGSFTDAGCEHISPNFPPIEFSYTQDGSIAPGEPPPSPSTTTNRNVCCGEYPPLRPLEMCACYIFFDAITLLSACHKCAGECVRPPAWCTFAGAVYVKDDCDGDGFLDHVCFGSDHRFGTISTSTSCIDDFPSGKDCLEFSYDVAIPAVSSVVSSACVQNRPF